MKYIPQHIAEVFYWILLWVYQLLFRQLYEVYEVFSYERMSLFAYSCIGKICRKAHVNMCATVRVTGTADMFCPLFIVYAK